MRAQVYVSVAVLGIALAPSVARADVLQTATECPPGMSRGGGLPDSLLGGLFAHDGPPRCAPALCETSARCGDGQRCRLDAHCIGRREERQLIVHPDGRRPPPDPNDPASYQTVLVTYDLGRCDDGRCPDETRCLQVATCRPAGEIDRSPIAVGGHGGWTAERTWTSATPYDAGRSIADPPPSTPPPAAEAPAPAARALPPEPSAAPPAAPDGCAAVAGRGRTGLPIIALALFLLRRRSRAPRSSTLELSE